MASDTSAVERWASFRREPPRSRAVNGPASRNQSRPRRDRQGRRSVVRTGAYQPAPPATPCEVLLTNLLLTWSDVRTSLARCLLVPGLGHEAVSLGCQSWDRSLSGPLGPLTGLRLAVLPGTNGSLPVSGGSGRAASHGHPCQRTAVFALPRACPKRQAAPSEPMVPGGSGGRPRPRS